jgi:hypothetical protein
VLGQNLRQRALADPGALERRRGQSTPDSRDLDDQEKTPETGAILLRRIAEQTEAAEGCGGAETVRHRA